MKLSKKMVQTAFPQPMQALITTLAKNSSRSAVKALAPAAITDNSTGVAGATLVAVPTQNSKVKQDGSNLASRTGFNTAIGKVNNANAVLAAYLSANGGDVLELGAFTGGNGNVAAAGTVPALDKSVAGVDGSAGDAMLRIEFNNAITRQRNNLATILRKYNGMAVSLGVPTVENKTLGHADGDFALGNAVTATSAVAAGAVASSDLATKAAADAALLALANDIATVAAKINTSLLAAGTLDGREAIALVA